MTRCAVLRQQVNKGIRCLLSTRCWQLEAADAHHDSCRHEELISVRRFRECLYRACARPSAVVSCLLSVCDSSSGVLGWLQALTQAERQPRNPAPRRMRTAGTPSSAWQRRPGYSTGIIRAAPLPPLEGPPTLADRTPAQVWPLSPESCKSEMRRSCKGHAWFRAMPGRLCSTSHQCHLRNSSELGCGSAC